MTLVAYRVSESAAGAIQHVHESRWYKILLPLVAPLTDPAVRRIMNSPAFQVRTACCSAYHTAYFPGPFTVNCHLCQPLMHI